MRGKRTGVVATVISDSKNCGVMDAWLTTPRSFFADADPAWIRKLPDGSDPKGWLNRPTVRPASSAAKTTLYDWLLVDG